MNEPSGRQFRGRFTGGLRDVQEMREKFLSVVSKDEWDLTWDEIDRFGVHGPLHKWTFGFTSKS